MILDFVHVTDLLSKYGISDSVMLMAGKFQSHIDISSKSRSILWYGKLLWLCCLF